LGRTPLHRAAGNGYKAVVKLLLDREATINTKDQLERILLYRAAKSGHKAVVKLLLDREATINTKDREG